MRTLLTHYSTSSRWSQLFLAMALGACAALGQAPFDLPILLFVAVTICFVLQPNTPSPMSAAWLGWAFGVGYFALALVWIVEPFLVDVGRHGWMAPFALLLISTGLALFWGLAFWSARRLSTQSWPLIFCWTLAEVLRAYVFTGFPWAGFAQSLVDSLGGQALAWVGPHGVMFALLTISWFLTLNILGRHRLWGAVWRGVAVTVAGLLVLLPPLSKPVVLSEHVVRLVQPNAAQHQKWDPDMIPVFFNRQLSFSAAPPDEGHLKPDLIVWPETAIPWLLEEADVALEYMTNASNGVPIAFGAQRSESGVYYNSLALLDGQGTIAQTYDKHHLVPFGEYLPLGHHLERFGLRGLAQTAGAGYGAGGGTELIDFGAIGAGLPLICYEAVFPQDVNTAPERPEFLLQITNDAWFGEYFGPQQHLAQARMRAIEQGLPLIRAANTGISAMIDPEGRILDHLPLGQAGYLDAALPEGRKWTLYSTVGDLPVIVALLAVLGICATSRWKQNVRRFTR